MFAMEVGGGGGRWESRWWLERWRAGYYVCLVLLGMSYRGWCNNDGDAKDGLKEEEAWRGEGEEKGPAGSCSDRPTGCSRLGGGRIGGQGFPSLSWAAARTCALLQSTTPSAVQCWGRGREAREGEAGRWLRGRVAMGGCPELEWERERAQASSTMRCQAAKRNGNGPGRARTGRAPGH